MRLRTTASLVIALMVPTLMPAMHAQTSNLLLVIEKGSQSLGLFDPVSGKEIATVPEGGVTGHEVAASRDGRYAYVPIYGNSGVGKPGTDGQKLVVIDLAAHKVAATLDFGHGVRPHMPAIGPEDGLLYVSTELDHSIAVVDAGSRKDEAPKIVGSVPTGQAESHMFVLSHDGRRGYTANVGPGTVSVLDMKTRKVIAIIPISAETQRISISPDDKYVFTSDQRSKRLAVIDTATNTIKQWIDLPGVGYGSYPTPDGKWLLLTLTAENKLAVIDLQTMKVAKTIDVPHEPVVVMVRPDGKRAYVSCAAADQVAEVDTGNWTVTRLIHTGKSPDGLAWASTR